MKPDPLVIKIDCIRLYVADLGNGRVQQFNTEGNFEGKFQSGKDPFDRPYDVAVDSSGDVWRARPDVLAAIRTNVFNVPAPAP